jgi:hypothetical protein
MLRSETICQDSRRLLPRQFPVVYWAQLGKDGFGVTRINNPVSTPLISSRCRSFNGLPTRLPGTIALHRARSYPRPLRADLRAAVRGLGSHVIKIDALMEEIAFTGTRPGETASAYRNPYKISANQLVCFAIATTLCYHPQVEDRKL